MNKSILALIFAVSSANSLFGVITVTNSTQYNFFASISGGLNQFLAGQRIQINLARQGDVDPIHIRIQGTPGGDIIGQLPLVDGDNLTFEERHLTFEERQVNIFQAVLNEQNVSDNFYRHIGHGQTQRQNIMW